MPFENTQLSVGARSFDSPPRPAFLSVLSRIRSERNALAPDGGFRANDPHWDKSVPVRYCNYPEISSVRERRVSLVRTCDPREPCSTLI